MAKRQRGVILSNAGEKKLRQTFKKLHDAGELSNTSRPTIMEFMESHTKPVHHLSSSTVSQILKHKKVERASLETFFRWFDLVLEFEDWVYPRDPQESKKNNSKRQKSAPPHKSYVTKSSGTAKFAIREKPLDESYQSSDQLSEPLYRRHLSNLNNLKVIGEYWTVEAPITQWRTASNGLQYRAFRVQERYSRRIDRAKCYDIEYLDTDEQASINTRISRHSKVVNKLVDCSVKGIPANRIYFPETNQSGRPAKWWIIDQWIEGESLRSLIENQDESFLGKNPMQFSRKLLMILSKLHKEDIIVRDLSPDSIVVRALDQQPFIVDFELAKLTTAVSSVSSTIWEPNVYRAPEVDESSENITPQADFYSWAMIVIAVAMGTMEPTKDLLTDCTERLPRKLLSQLETCLKIVPDERPTSSENISRAIGFWRF